MPRPWQNRPCPTKLTPTNWLANTRRWQALPEERKQHIRWEEISEDVARSMAFEEEPVAGGEIARDTRPDRATRYLDTALGVLKLNAVKQKVLYFMQSK